MTSNVDNYPFFQTILREFSEILRIPVIIILIAMILFSMFCIGWIIVEAFKERRHLNNEMPQLLENMKSGNVPLGQCIIDSGLLIRQKYILIELLKHPSFTKEERESFADNLIEKEDAYYNRKLKWTDSMAKVAPMTGLLGTLIPLGPGIIALGQGDTVTLSHSMLMAFDTTVAGLVVAAICIVISTLRKGWYDLYMSDLQTIVDFVLSAGDKS